VAEIISSEEGVPIQESKTSWSNSGKPAGKLHEAMGVARRPGSIGLEASRDEKSGVGSAISAIKGVAEIILKITDAQVGVMSKEGSDR
jgi:hypothetical protein